MKNKITEKQKDLLIQCALSARSFAYAPYSGFAVGAAVLGDDGNIYTGCNIENASYGAANCAERTAVFNAVSRGVRSIQAAAIAGGEHGTDINEVCFPCGICRQVLSEFCGSQTPVLLAGKSGSVSEYTLEELLPHAFNLKQTQK